MQNNRAVTLTSKGGLLDVLITPCHISEAYTPSPATSHPKAEPFNAIWDTGATGSVITDNVISRCGLKPTGIIQVHGVHGVKLAETFLVNVVLPNGVGFANIKVTRGQLQADVLIGMDIITRGDFSITNFGGKTVMSFRVPSCGVVDYVAENKTARQTPTFSKGGFSGKKRKRGK